MAADFVGESNCCGSAFDHPKDVGAVHATKRQLAFAADGSEKRAAALIGDVGCFEISINIRLGVVMSGNVVQLAAPMSWQPSSY